MSVLTKSRKLKSRMRPQKGSPAEQRAGSPKCREPGQPGEQSTARGLWSLGILEVGDRPDFPPLTYVAGVSDPQAHRPHVAQEARNAAQHETINLLKAFFCSLVFVSVCVFNVWPKTPLLPPVWPRDTKRLDTPAYVASPCQLPQDR